MTVVGILAAPLPFPELVMPCVWHYGGVPSYHDPIPASAILVLISLPAPNDHTPRQQEAIAYRGGNLLLEAVPGSGKTRVLVERCASLLADGMAASEVLLLTFSRRAVGELQARLSLALPGEIIPDVRTFHGFAARLLAEAGDAGRSRRLLSEPAERTLFERVVALTPLASLPADSARSQLFREAASARVDEIRRSPAAALVRLRATATPRVADLIKLDAAQKALRERLGVADYDDLVARALQLALTPDSAVARALHSRYRHVLVDEFQDTDPLQLALLEQFQAEIFAVGDAAQAIYGFRGAARDAMTRALATLAMTALPLDESFRCPAVVCDLARSVWPAALPLHTRVAAAGEIELRRAASPQDEAAFIGAAIAGAIAGGTPEREIAVIVRSAEPLARLVERDLRARGVGVARQGGENVLDDLAVDAIVAALKAFADPADTERWTRLLGHPVLGAAPLALRLALDAAPPRSVDDACKLVEALATDARVSGVRLATALRSAYDLFEAGAPVRAARCFAAEADILGFVIAGDENDAIRSGRRIVNFLDALGDVFDLHVRLDLDTSAAAVVAAFLAAGDSWRIGAGDLDDESGVRILTVHAAKGLEFELVVIADAVDGRFPQAFHTDVLLSEAEIETARRCGVDLGTRPAEHDAEERSLWYVAVTRTKRKLLVTWSETRIDGSPQRPSRFIPLGQRTRAAQQPSFRGPLQYAGAGNILDPQPPSTARLARPIATSSMETWLTCRRRFYYGALLRIGNDQRSFRAKLGTLVHRAIERFHSAVRDFRSVDEGAHVAWTSTLREHARAVVASDDAFDAFESRLETDAAIRAADRLLERYARELETSARGSAGGFQVAAVEERVNYDVMGIAFAGKIDRIDRLPNGSLVLVDVKTGAFKKEKAMANAFAKLHAAVEQGALWNKATPPANPQLALYRHAKPETGALAYTYLDARPKFGDFADAAHTDRLNVATEADALAAIDAVMAQTFFIPWTTQAVTRLEPTRNARTCRYCEFITVCPGYLEDDD